MVTVTNTEERVVMDEKSKEHEIEVLESLLNRRHSCRAFKTEAVPRETIQRILQNAQRTASDCNIQPWTVAIVSADALNRLRNEMYDRAAAGAPTVSDIPSIREYTGVYLQRRRNCGWLLYGTLGIEKGDRASSQQQLLENFRFFGAPHLAIIMTHASLGTRGAVDCGGYVANFILAAQALGVATITQAAIAHRVDVIREQLNIPPEHQIICGIAFGNSDEEHLVNSYRVPRASLEEVVSFYDE